MIEEYTLRKEKSEIEKLAKELKKFTFVDGESIPKLEIIATLNKVYLVDGFLKILDGWITSAIRESGLLSVTWENVLFFRGEAAAYRKLRRKLMRARAMFLKKAEQAKQVEAIKSISNEKKE